MATTVSRPTARSLVARLRITPLQAVAVLLILTTALALRLEFISQTPAYKAQADARDYDVHARSIAAGNGYSKRRAHGRATAFRPPGYPYFLAGVYKITGVEHANITKRIHAARVAQAFIGT